MHRFVLLQSRLEMESLPQFEVETQDLPYGGHTQLLFQEHSPLDISSPSITVRGESRSWLKFLNSLGGK